MNHRNGGLTLCNGCGLRYQKYTVICDKCHYVPMKTELPSPKCMRCAEVLTPITVPPPDSSGPNKRAREPTDDRESTNSGGGSGVVTPASGGVVTPASANPPPTPCSCGAADARCAGAGTSDGERSGKMARIDDGEAGPEYVRSFIQRRLGAGSDLKGVLGEFSVPENMWPPLTAASRDETTVTAVAMVIVRWLQDFLSMTAPKANGGFALQPSREDGGSTPMVGPRPYDDTRPLRNIRVHAGAERWDSAAAGLTVSLNVELNASTVAVSSGGTRPDVGHVVVLDNLFGEKENAEFLRMIVGSGGGGKRGPCPGGCDPCTCDVDQLPPSWGVKSALLTKLLDSDCEATVEVQTRLQQLYPEYTIAHVDESAVGVGVGARPHVVNAAVRGGDYQWHLGADPRALDGFGYPNREPGKPYFVTMLLYVNGGWPRGWDAETFFLDTKSDSGVFVRPAQFRTVLVDQDVMYRMSAPSKLANGTPSYSIAWKLLFVPKDSAMPPSVAKTDWGPSMRLGAANVV
jgi:hypothetical protein